MLKANDFSFIIEKHEHFPKQTYRNRTEIASPNGVLSLTLPVIKGSKNHTPIKDVKISYDIKWQRLHWLSLQTCYRSSAYFEFYEDSLRPFYEHKYEFLFEYNLGLLDWLFMQLKITPNYTFTDAYAHYPAEQDHRHRFTKNEADKVAGKPYFQVFSDRNAFIPNLSILDLLFNQGPQARTYL